MKYLKRRQKGGCRFARVGSTLDRYRKRRERLGRERRPGNIATFTNTDGAHANRILCLWVQIIKACITLCIALRLQATRKVMHQLTAQ